MRKKVGKGMTLRVNDYRWFVIGLFLALAPLTTIMNDLAFCMANGILKYILSLA